MDRKNSSLVQSEVISRIKLLLKDNNILEKDLAEHLGIGIETIKNWKRNKSDSYLHYLVEISEYLHVTPNYLLLGDDGMVIQEGRELFSKEELALISQFRKIGLNEKKYIKILLDGMVEHANGQ